MNDLRHAVRALIRTPGFTIVALLTLALGIGLNTSMFSVLNALLFRTPYPDDSRLVRIYRTTTQSQRAPHSAADFLDESAQATSFEKFAGVAWEDYSIAEASEPAERLPGLNVTADFFPMLGITPEIGRTFAAGEFLAGKNAVVVLSHSTWTQRFGGDPAILGRTLRLNGEPVTVIGVMPARFDFPLLWGGIGAWRPLALDEQARQNRNNHFLHVVAQLKPGVSAARAQVELDAIAARLAAAYPQENTRAGARLIPLAGSGQDDFGIGLTWMMCALCGFVLLIACANLANLQFARHATRAGERAVRMALGATRSQLARTVLTECLVLSIVGGALGLLLAAWANAVVERYLTFSGVRVISLSIDVRALAFTFGAALIAGLAFGALPAWFSSRVDINGTMKQGSRGTTMPRSHYRLRHALIVAEFALAMVLLAGAGFFLRSIDRFLLRDPGWQVNGLVSGRVSLRGEKYADPARRRAFFQQLEERLAAIPGVDHAAFGSNLPTWGFGNFGKIVVDGREPPAPGGEPVASAAEITSDYFHTLGIPLRSGRAFATSDDDNGRPVVIINETMARQLWPNENPLGKRIGWANAPHDWREIVGVVSDVSPAMPIGGGDARFQIYRPILQATRVSIALALRTRRDAASVVNEVRNAVASIDADQPVFMPATVREEVDTGLTSIRLAGKTLGVFALSGVFLAALGIYGVLSGYVAQRRPEIGLRMALGARSQDVLLMVLRRGAQLALLGTAIGLVGAYGVARLLATIAPALPAADLATTLVVISTLLGMAALACWPPARRATKVDPMIALRAE